MSILSATEKRRFDSSSINQWQFRIGKVCEFMQLSKSSSIRRNDHHIYPSGRRISASCSNGKSVALISASNAHRTDYIEMNRIDFIKSVACARRYIFRLPKAFSILCFMHIFFTYSQFACISRGCTTKITFGLRIHSPKNFQMILVDRKKKKNRFTCNYHLNCFIFASNHQLSAAHPQRDRRWMSRKK